MIRQPMASAPGSSLLPSTAAVARLAVRLWICCGGTVPACTSPKTYLPPSYDGSDRAAQTSGQAEGQAGCERANADPEKHERRNNTRRTFQCLQNGLEDWLQACVTGDRDSLRRTKATARAQPGTVAVVGLGALVVLRVALLKLSVQRWQAV